MITTKQQITGWGWWIPPLLLLIYLHLPVPYVLLLFELGVPSWLESCGEVLFTPLEWFAEDVPLVGKGYQSYLTFLLKLCGVNF